MAKKKKNSPNAEQEDTLPRKGTMTIQAILKDVAALRTIAGEYESITKDITSEGFKEIDVDGIQKFPRAMKLLRQYRAALVSGLERKKATKVEA